MLLAVLDVGSNSAHLQIVEARPDDPPQPVYRLKSPTLLADSVTADGALTPDGVDRVVRAVADTVAASRRHDLADLIPLATATIRDATNNAEIRRRVREATGVELRSMTGEDEARVTYLAVRRWLSHSPASGSSPVPESRRPRPRCGDDGRTGKRRAERRPGQDRGDDRHRPDRPPAGLLLLDIGGMSMELAAGTGEAPDLAVSLPLGAGLLTRRFLPDHPAPRDAVERVRRQVLDSITPVAHRIAGHTRPDRVIGTSKTFKQLAALTGEDARLTRRALHRWLPRLAAMTPAERAKLPGVAPSRARQLLAGAITAATAMEALDLRTLDVCPWALREGLLLRRFTELNR